MMRLSLKNTFLEVVYNEDSDQGNGRGHLNSSPTAVRSRSAEGCLDSSPTSACSRSVEGQASPQLERLNVILGSPSRHTKVSPRCAIFSIADEGAANCSLFSIADEDEEAVASSVGSCLVSRAMRRKELSDSNTGSTTASEQASVVAKEYCHKFVPRKLDLECQSRSSDLTGKSSHLSTLMIRNVPNRYTQLDLLAELEELGYKGTFDFLYLPMDKCSKASVGYAFVNLISPSWAAGLEHDLQGHRFTRYGKNKEARVSVAHLQGLAANLAYYEKCAVKSAKAALHRPLLVADGLTPLPR